MALAPKSVLGALRRFLPEYLSTSPPLSADQRRALWAITRCRTPALGGRAFACSECRNQVQFAWHSCNHKACPQCGRSATAQWVGSELHKLVEAPYYWGVHIQPAGNGGAALRYLGAYVARTAIGDGRLLRVGDATVSFRWKNRDAANRPEVSTIPGVEFVARYLRHVLPRGLRSIRYYGFCHPAARVKRLRVQCHAGGPVQLGASMPLSPPPAPIPLCPCCRRPMLLAAVFSAPYRQRGPPAIQKVKPSQPTRS